MMQIVRGGRVVGPAGRRADHADILIDGDTIREIGPPGMPAAHAVEIDATGRLLMPGLVNAHTHGHANLSKGAGDRWTLELMQNALAGLTGRRTAEDKALATRIGAVEMVRKGCTAAYDLAFEYPGPTGEGIAAAAQAYADVGMRAVVAPMIWERTLYEVVPGLMDALPDALRREAERFALPPADASLEALEAMLRDWPFDRAQVRPAVAPTIPSFCSDDLLVRLGNLARDYGVGFHTHLSESKVQAVAARTMHERSATAHLADLGILSPVFTAAHAVWVDAEDLSRLADSGSSVAHNPGSNARLGNGIAPVRDMLDRGINVAIGTDSCTCSDNQNVFEAMRIASFMIRVQEVDPARWPTAEEILGMATEGGARALGFEGEIGALVPGRKADIVFLDLGAPHYVPLNDALNQIVYAEDGTGVDSVMIGGRFVMRDRAMTTVDEARLKEDAQRAVERLYDDANRIVRDRVSALEADLARRCLALLRAPYPVERHAHLGLREA